MDFFSWQKNDLLFVSKFGILEPKNNNLVFVISGKRRGNNIIYVLKDIPIKRWFDVALVVYYGVVEIYFNGKLMKFSVNLV